MAKNAADKNRRSIVVGPGTWERLKALSEKEEQSMSSLIREALLMLLGDREKRAGIYDPAKDKMV